jgi:putative ABC transport system permease protein
MTSIRLPVRAYHALLWIALPRHVRGRFMSDAVTVFADVAREASADGPLGPWRALAAEVPGIIRFAFAQRAATPRDLYLPVVEEQSVTASFTQDLRYAVRALRNAPVFTAVVVLTLSLGIGANAAIFSVVSGVLLKPLAVHEPERLVALGEGTASSTPTNYGATSAYNYFAWAAASKTMRIAAISPTPMIYSKDGAEPERLLGTGVLGDFLGMIQARPMLGRFVLPSDQVTSAERVVVLSHALWTSHFGADSSVLGKSITLANTARRIVGVMPPEFRYPANAAQFWVPLRLDPGDEANHDQYYLQPIGRLLPGATIDQARAEMDLVASRLKRDWPVFNADLRIVAFPVMETTVSGVRRQLWVLMGAVGFVLLITCANLGNLLMARASARRRELAVRQALGAGRRRIAQQLLTESFVLAFLGAGLGLGVGELFLRMILAAQVSLNLPRIDDIALDWRVVAFTLGVGGVAGLFFGTFPIWELGKAKFTDTLRAGTRAVTGRQRMRDVLVVSQLALAMILLTGAGLLIRSFQRLQSVDPGFSAKQVLTFAISGDSSFARTLLARLRELPGVRSVAQINQLPVTGRGGGAWFNRMDRTLPPGATPQGEVYRVVTPEIFSTLGIRIQRGRALEPTDGRANPVVVVNAALARKYYPDEDALGKKIYLGAPDNRIIDNATIVGISDDTRDGGMAADPLPIVYLSTAYGWATNFAVVINTTGEAAALAGPVRAAVREIDPRAPIRALRTMDDVVTESFASARWSTTLVGVFALVALLVTLVGIFGVLSFIVAQRTKELGIRLALGAPSGAVQRLVVGRGLWLASAGLVVGSVGAYYLTRAMTGLLYEVKPADPLTMTVVAVALLGMALLASYVPARRATRIDPLAALRSD